MITIKTNKDTYYIKKYNDRYLLEKDFPPCCDISLLCESKDLQKLVTFLGSILTNEDVEDIKDE